MAKKLTPDALRKQALEIMNRAKELEKEENAKVGAYVRNIAQSGFEIDYNEFMTKVSNLFKTENLSTGNPKEKSNGSKDKQGDA